MIETSLNVTDYPEPPEPKEMCYGFEFSGSISGCGVVYAENPEQAKERILNRDYDDIINTWGMQIEEIVSIEEE